MSGQSPLDIIEIARLSGVSRSTVSRVLNNHPNVAEATRQRVQKIIEENDFKPHPVARALVSQRSNVISLLIPYSASDLFSDPFFPILLQAITTEANRLEFSVTLWLTSTQVDKDTFYNRVLSHRLVDGLIIASAMVDYPFLERLNKQHKPFIFIGRPHVEAERTSFVDVQAKEGSYQIVRHMIERGRRKIAFIPGVALLESSLDRQRGYEQALIEGGLKPDSRLIAPPGNFKEEGGYQSMNILMQRVPDLDAVYVASDVMAIGVMRAITDAGKRVPQDIAVGGFDDMPFSAKSHPSLTTLRQPIDILGEKAVYGLIQLIENRQEEPFQEVYPVELIVRDST